MLGFQLENFKWIWVYKNVSICLKHENQPVAVESIDDDVPNPDGKTPNEVKFGKYGARL